MIRIENLAVRVGDFRLALSLNVAAGEYFVLLGATGSGKTVLLETLAGLKKIESGRIVVGSNDVTRADPCDRNVGYVPQDYALFSNLDVFDNIAFGLTERRTAAAEKRRIVGEYADNLKIGHLLARSVGHLSGGEKQRVALARALATRPGLLLLDEPVSALDEVTREPIVRMLRSLPATYGVTVLHVCHSFVETRALADRAAVIRNGGIVKTGSAADVIRFMQEETDR